MRTAETAPTPAASPSSVMDLLSKGIPLSLLLDLAMGPHSRLLLDEERVPAQRRATR